MSFLLFIFIVQWGFIEIFVTTIILDLFMNHMCEYSNNVEEICLSHKYEKLGKGFNKEYFELYNKNNIIKGRIFIYCTYFIYLILEKISNVFISSNLVDRIFQYAGIVIGSPFLGILLGAVIIALWIEVKDRKK